MTLDINTHNDPSIYNSQSRYPLHFQVRVNDAMRGTWSRHRRCPNAMRSRPSSVSDKLFDVPFSSYPGSRINTIESEALECWCGHVLLGLLECFLGNCNINWGWIEAKIDFREFKWISRLERYRAIWRWGQLRKWESGITTYEKRVRRLRSLQLEEQLDLCQQSNHSP